jgi:hypothetical protein
MPGFKSSDLIFGIPEPSSLWFYRNRFGGDVSRSFEQIGKPRRSISPNNALKASSSLALLEPGNDRCSRLARFSATNKRRFHVQGNYLRGLARGQGLWRRDRLERRRGPRRT